MADKWAKLRNANQSLPVPRDEEGGVSRLRVKGHFNYKGNNEKVLLVSFTTLHTLTTTKNVDDLEMFTLL